MYVCLCICIYNRKRCTIQTAQPVDAFIDLHPGKNSMFSELCRPRNLRQSTGGFILEISGVDISKGVYIGFGWFWEGPKNFTQSPWPSSSNSGGFLQLLSTVLLAGVKKMGLSQIKNSYLIDPHLRLKNSFRFFNHKVWKCFWISGTVTFYLELEPVMLHCICYILACSPSILQGIRYI